MNKNEIIKKQDSFIRQAKRLNFCLKFWTGIASVTRFGIHGFIQMMIRRTLGKIAKYNERATQFNRQIRKERRRARAIRK